MGKLTDARLRGVKAKGKKTLKLSDGNGLYLEVMKNGKKYWCVRFQNLAKQYNINKTIGELSPIVLQKKF